MKPCRCLYNHELLIAFITQSPRLAFTDDVTDAYISSFVHELRDTDVDCLMVCPTAWRCVLWPSAVDPRWEREDFEREEPGCWTDLKFYERAFWRIRRYMKTGHDPVQVTVDAARQQDLNLFFSYRMNDNHYFWDRNCPTHDAFAVEHPEYSLDPEGRSICLDYGRAEVRDYYLALLRELCETYGPEGLELDFMRHPVFFPPGNEQEGRPILTDFVRRVRSMLDELGEDRDRRLALSVRVPHSPEACRAAALDVLEWDRQGLVDIINVSPHFICTLEPLELDAFRNQVRNARIYGELCHHTGQVQTGAFTNNILCKCTPIQYETGAHAFLSQGADGISFFNFAYCRDNSLGEPRRAAFPGIEPRFDVLEHITDRARLHPKAKHYWLTTGPGQLPADIPAQTSVDFPLTVYADPELYEFGLLRILTEENHWERPLRALVNGHELQQTCYTGEPFVPDTFEGVPPPQQSIYYRLPPETLRNGTNVITLHNHIVKGWLLGITCRKIELALYPRPPVSFTEAVLS